MRKGMEPKAIKEEALEKEANYVEAPAPTPRTRSSKGPPKDRCKTPDSPEGARQATTPLSPSQSSPTRRTNGSASPVNGSADSLTPPLPVSLDSAPRTASVSDPQLLHYPAGRQLVKVKRFLSTLVQFGADIGQDVGERVKTLVLNLVSSNLSIEEFHHSLQDVTNFPLRPFVLPFLRAHLPLFQREIHTLARANKQSALQYVRTHDHVLQDQTSSPTEPSEIFMGNESGSFLTTGLKRRTSDSFENGLNGQTPSDSSDYVPALKRQPLSNAFMLGHQPSIFLPSSNGNPSGTTHLFDYSHPQQRNEETGRGEEEWRNIHVMLNCILSMVEKTKRALTILQQRNNQELTSEWLRKQDVSLDLKKAANEIMAQAVRQTEDRVADVKRRAEDAVNDVKRQAVIELQKAVSTAEAKANELVAVERAKIEKILAEARNKHEDSATTSPEASGENNLSPASSQQNSCWNCGRKAHETCSGCSVARYCGSFCQHKDWENHHQVCKDKVRPLRVPTPSTAPATLATPQASEVKFKK